MEENKTKSRGWFNNTILFLVVAIIFVFLLSIVGSLLNWEGTYYEMNPVTESLDSNLVIVESLFSREGIRYIIGNIISNFINFTPLIMFIFSMIGIGFAEKTGLFRGLFGLFGNKSNKYLLTFSVVLFSIISTILGEVSFVFVIPIVAILYLTKNRNPIIGIIASFVGMALGYGVNIYFSQLDYNLIGYTNVGASLIDKAHVVFINGNLYFGIIATVLLSILITYITEKFIAKKVPKYRKEEVIEVSDFKNKKGLFLCGIILIIAILFYIYMLIPFGTPLSGLLLDYAEKDSFARIFSNNSYVIQGLSFMILVSLLLCGFVYGTTAKTIKDKNDLSNYIYNSLNNMGGSLVLFFFVSQLIALFKKSNLGIVFTTWIGNFIENSNFSSLPLVITFFILVMIINIFQTSSIVKWSILAPLVIPTFMKANMTPEFTQIVFRVADSMTNIITPFFPYFVVFIGVLFMYNKEESLKLKDIYKILWPYLVGVFVFWILLLFCFYILNLPIGPNVSPIL